ncbi:hypothetical protein GN956_G7280 [Arapaima gigas]
MSNYRFKCSISKRCGIGVLRTAPCSHFHTRHLKVALPAVTSPARCLGAELQPRSARTAPGRGARIQAAHVSSVRSGGASPAQRREARRAGSNRAGHGEQSRR